MPRSSATQHELARVELLAESLDQMAVEVVEAVKA
jgi:hypothetical protein